MKTKRIPFDFTRINENGLIIETKCGLKVSVLRTNAKGKYPIVVLIDNGTFESCVQYDKTGTPKAAWEDLKLIMRVHTDCEQRKPKFQEGDWVIFHPGCNAHQIVRVVENATSHTYGYDTVDDYYFNDTAEGVRLWNINDAKDGDVLHSIGLHNDCIFIFDRLDNWKFDADGDRAVATGYCCISIAADKMEFGIQGPDCIEVNTVKPATKKQRDLLFQKMKEAGYQWDKEKRELKKIKVGNVKKGVKKRRMTNQELSWWLRDCPEEYREVCRVDEDTVYSRYIYLKCDANDEVPEYVRIRKNGGEWEEPLIEE